MVGGGDGVEAEAEVVVISGVVGAVAEGVEVGLVVVGEDVDSINSSRYSIIFCIQ